MRETFKMMQSILTGKEKDTEEKILIQQYKENLSPNILAYFYCKNIGIIQKLVDIYPSLLEEDKVSYCLQELDNCLQNYDFNKSKFITYYYNCCFNRLSVEYRKSKNFKNKVSTEWSYLEDCNLTKDIYIDYNFDTILESYNLTKDEEHQCKLLNFGYTIKEISKILKVKPQVIYYRNKKIKQKILGTF